VTRFGGAALSHPVVVRSAAAALVCAAVAALAGAPADAQIRVPWEIGGQPPVKVAGGGKRALAPSPLSSEAAAPSLQPPTLAEGGLSAVPVYAIVLLSLAGVMAVLGFALRPRDERQDERLPLPTSPEDLPAESAAGGEAEVNRGVVTDDAECDKSQSEISEQRSVWVPDQEDREHKGNVEPTRRPEKGAAPGGGGTEPASPKYTEIGGQVARLLRAAEQIRTEVAKEAEEIRVHAEMEAAATSQRLTGEAERLRLDAEAYAHETRLAADSYAREENLKAEKQAARTVGKADARASAVVKAAEEHADEILLVARQRHAHLRNELQSLEDQIRGSAGNLRRIAADLDELPQSRQEPTSEDFSESQELTDEELLTDALGPDRRRGLFSRKER
jgi:hypothetical protein